MGEAAHEIDERFRVYLGTEVYFGQDVADKLKEGKILFDEPQRDGWEELPTPSQTQLHQTGDPAAAVRRIRSHTVHVECYHCIAENVELAERTVRYGCEPARKRRQHHRGSGRKIRKFIEELMNRDLGICVGPMHTIQSTDRRR